MLMSNEKGLTHLPFDIFVLSKVLMDLTIILDMAGQWRAKVFVDRNEWERRKDKENWDKNGHFRDVIFDQDFKATVSSN